MSWYQAALESMQHDELDLSDYNSSSYQIC